QRAADGVETAVDLDGHVGSRVDCFESAVRDRRRPRAGGRRCDAEARIFAGAGRRTFHAGIARAVLAGDARAVAGVGRAEVAVVGARGSGGAGCARAVGGSARGDRARLAVVGAAQALGRATPTVDAEVAVALLGDP